jgi:hypothetical protein
MRIRYFSGRDMRYRELGRLIMDSFCRYSLGWYFYTWRYKYYRSLLPSSKLYTNRYYIRGVVLVRIEHMSGDLHLFVTQSGEKPPRDVEFALIRPGSLRHQPDPQPRHRRHRQLRPCIPAGDKNPL